MFDGKGVISLNEDYLDFSFDKCDDKWTIMMPKGSVRFTTFDVGDEKAGPTVLFGYLDNSSDEVIPWDRVDPYHYHGSDHFRAVCKGNYLLTDGQNDKRMRSGDFHFQNAGVLYREIPEEDTCVWLMHVVGDRRGIRATIPSKSDREKLIYSGNPNDKPLGDDENYPDGIPRKGIPAIKSTLGSCNKDGYLDGSFDKLTGTQKTYNEGKVDWGYFGDSQRGPLSVLVNFNSNSTVSGESICNTERVIFVVGGSCLIGKTNYESGSIRIQSAGSTLPSITAGKSGVKLAILIADRRAIVESPPSDGAGMDWDFSL